MRFYKNVDICDLESILKKGILSAEKAENFRWGEGNRANNAYYSAKIIKNGQRTTETIEWEERKTLEDTEEKLNSKRNPVKTVYENMVRLNRSKHDPNGEIWAKIVAFVKENEPDFFTKTGDFRKHIKKDVWERLDAAAKTE